MSHGVQWAMGSYGPHLSLWQTLMTHVTCGLDLETKHREAASPSCILIKPMKKDGTNGYEQSSLSLYTLSCVGVCVISVKCFKIKFSTVNQRHFVFVFLLDWIPFLSQIEYFHFLILVCFCVESKRNSITTRILLKFDKRTSVFYLCFNFLTLNFQPQWSQQ